MPRLSGRPICVRHARCLVAHRGKLLSGAEQPGFPVYAASFIRARTIIFDTELMARPRLLQLILLHEVFHFVWARLGNRKRAEFAGILEREMEGGARGELGESAGVEKERLRKCGGQERSRSWRQYVCESFCDTAAWFYSGRRSHPAVTLAPRWRGRREHWFRVSLLPDTGARRAEAIHWALGFHV